MRAFPSAEGYLGKTLNLSHRAESGVHAGHTSFSLLYVSFYHAVVKAIGVTISPSLPTPPCLIATLVVSSALSVLPPQWLLALH